MYDYAESIEKQNQCKWNEQWTIERNDRTTKKKEMK